MQSLKLRVAIPTLFALLLLAVALVAAPLAPAALAQESVESPALPRTITVVGEGKTSIKPDIARVNIGVEVMKASVQEASAENKATVEAVLAALEAAGVEGKDIQTSGYSVYVERYGPEGPLPEDDLRYRVSNNVTVKIRDLENVGTLLDAAIEAGANNIYGVEFALDDASEARSLARAKAVENALAKAEELAGLAGVEVGQIVSLSEIIGSSGGYYNQMVSASAYMGLGGGGGTPVSPGELEVTYQIQVVYTIAD